MKKQMYIIVIAVCLFITMSLSWVFAVEKNADCDTQGDEMMRTLPQTSSQTVKDRHGNKYKVSGVSSITGKKANVQTSFKVTLYKGGKRDVVDAYSKNLSCTGRVWFHGAASDNHFSNSATKTGGQNTYSLSDTYDFYIKTLHGTHGFSCEGATANFSTQM